MSTRDGRQLPLGWLAVAAIFIATAPAWLSWLDSAPNKKPDADFARPPAASTLLGPPLEFLSNQELFRELGASDVRSARVADPVGSAADLKRVFDNYIDNPDPRERRKAVRAFQACVPMFLSVSGELALPKRLIAALPAEKRVEREMAYRSLFARCEGFAPQGSAALAATAEALRNDEQSHALGVIAQEQFAFGLVVIEPLVQEALNGTDPAAVTSLTGLSQRLARMRDPRADATQLQHARETDAALPWVACDLGLECSEQSLSALQLCAVEALCEGDVQARLSARRLPSGVDPDAVQKERVRLFGLIRGGRPLTSADLLGRP